jgi:hypothetical protein
MNDNFGLLILVFLASVVLPTLWSRKRAEQRELSEQSDALSLTMLQNLRRDGSLVDDILCACKNNPRVKEEFEATWREPTLELQRKDFCLFALKYAFDFYDVECALLTTEFVSAYRFHIQSLPQEHQKYYRPRHSVYEMNPDDTPISSLVAEAYGVLEYEKLSTKEKQEQLIVWNLIHLPDDEEKRESVVDNLVCAFRRHDIVFRFKRKQFTWSRKQARYAPQTVN